MTDQPDALRLAAQLHQRTPWDSSLDRQAAAELRRLHEAVHILQAEIRRLRSLLEDDGK